MSQKCPLCGVFSPDRTVRCACGYDFTTRTLKPSGMRTHFGNRMILEESALRDIGVVVLVLALAGTFVVIPLTMATMKSGGGAYVVIGVGLAGAYLLYKGLRHRRHARRRHSDIARPDDTTTSPR